MIKYLKDLLEVDIVLIRTFVDLLAALGNHGVDEALIKVSAVNPLSCHKVKEVFERALKAVVEMSSHIPKYVVSLILREDEL